MRELSARAVNVLARPALCVLAVGSLLVVCEPVFAQQRDPGYHLSVLPHVGHTRASVGLHPARFVEGGRAHFHSDRFWIGNGVLLALDVGTLVALSELWYSDYEQTSFHFHDDWKNWRQQDKLGHLVTGWGIARVVGSYALWSGMRRETAAWYGGIVSLVFLSQIEILDGFSAGWGASWTDVAFNVVGATVGGMQVAHPELDMVTMRYSYRKSDFFDEEISWLGNAIKDYEGITFWVAFRPSYLIDGWPRWLGFSIGHGASGLETALPTETSPHQREVYVGIDLDILHAIHWPRPWMKNLADALSIVRIPAPVLRIHPKAEFIPLF